MKTTANFSLWTSDDLAYWLNTINLSKYANNIKSNNITGYDLCYLTNEDFKELGISNIHDKNVLVKNIRMQTLEQLKLVFTYDKRDAVVQLDFDSNFTVYELENYIKEIFQISYNVHISTEEGEMLSPNIKIIELILLNPLKYKRLKIVKGIANIQMQGLLNVNNIGNDNNMNSNNNNSSSNINSDLNLNNNNVVVNTKPSTKYGTMLSQQNTQNTVHSELSTVQPQRMNMNMNINMNANTPQPPTSNVIVNQRGLYNNNSKSNIPSIDNNNSSSNNTPSTIMNYPTPMYYENRTIDNAISSTGNRDIINDPYSNNNNDMLLMNGTPKKYLTDKRIYRNSSAIAMKPGNNALEINYSRKYNMDYAMNTNIINNNNTNTNINPSGNNTIIGIKNDSTLNYDYKTQMIPKEFSLNNNNNTNTSNPNNNNNSTIINTSGYNWKFKKDEKLN